MTFSAQDPQGERGLAWLDVDFTKVKVPRLTSQTPICSPGPESKTLCTFQAVGHIAALFNPNDGPIKLKLPRDKPSSSRKSFTYEVLGARSLALVGGAKANVCKVTYTQGFYDNYTEERPYMEAQVYSKTSPGPDTKEYTFSVRYAELVTISGNRHL